jgi:hypothetical protein
MYLSATKAEALKAYQELDTGRSIKTPYNQF